MSGALLARCSFFVAVAIAGGACRKSQPAAPSPEESRLVPIEVTKDGRWLFTFVEPNGQFATTHKIDELPKGARRLVRVVDISQGARERRDTTNVYVVDADELLAKGKAKARPLSREAFETGALAQLPPGESSSLAAAPPSASPAASTDAGLATGSVPAIDGEVVVTLYGTSWCGACKSARQYLTARKIAFADKDIERDSAAARELADKAARLGIPADRVPILDVRGRLLIGFDKARLETLLGEAS